MNLSCLCEVGVLFDTGNEKTIERTLYLDGVKIESKHGIARVYQQRKIHVYVYNQALANKILSKSWDKIGEIETIYLPYSMESSTGDWKPELEIIFVQEGTFIQFIYNTTHQTKSFLNEFSEIFKRVVNEYPSQTITFHWDEIYNWMAVALRIEEKETVVSSVSSCISILDKLGKQVLDLYNQTTRGNTT